MSLTLVTAPTVEPISVDEAKEHLRVDVTTDDTYIHGLIGTAREMAEELTGRAFITQTLAYWLDGWPASGVIVLPRPPLQSVTSVLYYDTDDTEATFASSNYHVDTDAIPGRIILNSGATWPTTTLRPGHAVKVTFVAGEGDTAGEVNNMDKHTVRVILSDFYENRESNVVGSTVSPLPMSLRQMLWQNRVMGVR